MLHRAPREDFWHQAQASGAVEAQALAALQAKYKIGSSQTAEKKGVKLLDFEGKDEGKASFGVELDWMRRPRETTKVPLILRSLQRNTNHLRNKG